LSRSLNAIRLPKIIYENNNNSNSNSNSNSNNNNNNNDENKNRPEWTNDVVKNKQKPTRLTSTSTRSSKLIKSLTDSLQTYTSSCTPPSFSNNNKSISPKRSSSKKSRHRHHNHHNPRLDKLFSIVFDHNQLIVKDKLTLNLATTTTTTKNNCKRRNSLHLIESAHAKILEEPSQIVIYEKQKSICLEEEDFRKKVYILFIFRLRHFQFFNYAIFSFLITNKIIKIYAYSIEFDRVFSFFKDEKIRNKEDFWWYQKCHYQIS
jgi:hypothetical protein